jgi:hypothetical protein
MVVEIDGWREVKLSHFRPIKAWFTANRRNRIAIIMVKNEYDLMNLSGGCRDRLHIIIIISLYNGAKLQGRRALEWKGSQLPIVCENIREPKRAEHSHESEALTK